MYMLEPSRWSITEFAAGGQLQERGGAWLFLRWLGDQKGDGIFRRLVETSLTGVRNVEDKAGEPFARMFGDFSIAAYAYDGLSGVQRSAMPERYRFLSRDFRVIFKRFFDVGGDDFDRVFPIVPTVFAPGASVFNSMVPGTATWYELRTGTAPRVTLNFGPNGGTGFEPALGAQVTVLRLQPAP
jgi:hypothetical protein